MFDRIKKAMAYIITAIVLIALLVLQFVDAFFKEFNSNEFITGLVINSILLIVISLVWLTDAKNRAKTKVDTAYFNNSKQYSLLVGDITKNKQHKYLESFCKEKEAEIKLEREVELLNSVCIDYEDYLEKYKGKTKQELKELNTLQRKQISIINKVNSGKVKSERINPLEITTNCKSNKKYDISYNENLDTNSRIAFRVVKCIVVGCVTAILGYKLSSNIADITAWVNFVLQVLMCISTAWSSANEGDYMINVVKNNVVLKRIDFLNQFFEWTSSKQVITE